MSEMLAMITPRGARPGHPPAGVMTSHLPGESFPAATPGERRLAGQEKSDDLRVFKTKVRKCLRKNSLAVHPPSYPPPPGTVSRGLMD